MGSRARARARALVATAVAIIRLCVCARARVCALNFAATTSKILRRRRLINEIF